jgi:hypothetical protein
MSITAIVENNTIKLPVHVPDGTRAEIILKTDAKAEPQEGSFFDSMRELIGSIEGPADMAAEHDHYAHGAPRRGEK